jgi:RNA polymerase sigma-70 factor (ECF subfamily)
LIFMLQTRTSLLQRVRDHNDAGSWQEFVELYEPLLLSYVRSRGVPDADARDTVQDVFLLLLRALPTFKLDHTRGRFRTWLWQVTMNALADRGRRRNTRDRAEEGWRHQSGPPVTTDEPDREWINAHRRRVVEFVLPRVKERTQEKTWYCFEEHVLKGRSGAEVAAEVGITANAVCVNAARVLAKVRDLCAEYMEELADDDGPLS